MILVASCPGGTASNVIAYLAHAEVALSVTMTACSTLAAIFMTPFLTLQLSGSLLEIPAAGLFYSTFKVVLIPIALGVLLNNFLPKTALKMVPYAPSVAVFLISFIVASIVGQGKEIILSSGVQLIFALFCLHLFGFIIGFLVSLGVLKNWRVAKPFLLKLACKIQVWG